MTTAIDHSASRAAPTQHLVQDEAYLLASRGVVEIRGRDARTALQDLLASSIDPALKKGSLAYVLDDAGCVLADTFVVERDGTLLVDWPHAALPDLMTKLVSRCEGRDAQAEVVSDRWRVLAELPDRAAYAEGGIRYADPRWHMGSRVLRSREEPESYAWGHEIHWRTHAFRLGVLPDALLISGLRITALEANLHSMGLLDEERVGGTLRDALSEPALKTGRRILPFRVEPTGIEVPTMIGLSIVAGEQAIGAVIGHHGLFGLAIVTLDAWRSALGRGQRLACASEQVLVTWPTWLARESRGRSGPAAGQQPGGDEAA